jgi:tape measure domain-containing protein
MADAQIKITADTSQAERALGSLQRTLAGLLTIGAISKLAVDFKTLADEAINLQNKLGLVSVAGQTSSELFDLMTQRANLLGVGTKDLGDLFFRISLNTKDLGLTQVQTLRTTELLMKGFQMTGMSMAEASSATIQLGQAFGQGVVRGDELLSVQERLPLVAQALADKFNVQRGALKYLGEQGKITSKDLYDAIQSQGAALDAAFLQKIPTIQNALNVLGNTISSTTKKFDEQNGVSRAVSYAILIVADAVITVFEWFQKWGGVIGVVVEALILLYAPIRVIRFVLGVLEAGIASVTAIFAPLVAVAEGSAGIIAGTWEALGILASKLFPGMTSRIAGLGAALAGVATTLGLGSLIDGVKNLFGQDKKTLAENYEAKLNDINKRLGVDNVKANNDAAQASKGATAQQVSDAEKIRKATQDRNEDLRKVMQSQKDSLALSTVNNSELKIEETVLSTNRGLIKDILNDKGKIIGYTKGLNAEEEATLRLTLAQTIQNSTLRDLKKDLQLSQLDLNVLSQKDLDIRAADLEVEKKRYELGALFTTEMESQLRATVATKQAIQETLATEQQLNILRGTASPQSREQRIQTVTGVLQTSDPRLALTQDYATKKAAIDKAISDNEIGLLKLTQSEFQTMLSARTNLEIEYRNAKELADIEFQNRELFRAQAHSQALMDLQSKIFEAKKLAEIQAATGTQFGYETQKAMAKEGADFEKKSALEKTQFGIEQGANLFATLGQQNRQAFEASKAMNIAMAIMNTYMGATKALATYPWPFGLIAAAAAVAAGMAQVGAIRSQQYTGRATGGPVASGTPYIVGEQGRELFVPSTAGTIIPNGQMGGGAGGGTTVNFNITANDTQGFDDLLIKRRGLITQVIRDAQLERGQRLGA